MIGIAVIGITLISTIVWVLLTRKIGRFFVKKAYMPKHWTWLTIWTLSFFLVTTDTFIGVPYAVYMCNKYGGYKYLSNQKPNGIFLNEGSLYIPSIRESRWDFLSRAEGSVGDIDHNLIFKYLYATNNFVEIKKMNTEEAELVRWRARPNNNCMERMNSLDYGKELDLKLQDCIHEEKILKVTAEATLKYKFSKSFGLPIVQEIYIASPNETFSNFTWIYHTNRSYLPLHQLVISLLLPDECDCQMKANTISEAVFELASLEPSKHSSP